jgi:hypothetical protein
MFNSISDGGSVVMKLSHVRCCRFYKNIASTEDYTQKKLVIQVFMSIKTYFLINEKEVLEFVLVLFTRKRPWCHEILSV